MPRAFSVARWQDGEGEEAHYLLEDVGPGTHRLCELRAGEEVWALGAARPAASRRRQEGRRAILVEGGVGIAPLAILAGRCSWAASRRRCARGAAGLPRRRSRHGGTLLHGAQIATDDGTVGHHGLVTDLLGAGARRGSGGTVVYACGPAADARGHARDVRRARRARTLALESGMACGFGACFGCVVPTEDGGYVRVCVEGPVIRRRRWSASMPADARSSRPRGAVRPGGP